MGNSISIGGRRVGSGSPCFVIAEIGSNFDQKLSQAKELIDAAADCKVDAVKFQLFKGDLLYPAAGKIAGILKKFEFPREWLKELHQYALSKGLVFMATPFDKEAVDLLTGEGLSVLKWASPEIYDVPLLKYAAGKGVPVILSTGMCSVGDVEAAVRILEMGGLSSIALLHCISLYPTAPQDANLRMMDTLARVFPYPVGFSDHTRGTAVPLAAVARGACILEKHFTLDRKLPGPDHSFALEPAVMKKLVADIRDIEMSLGSPVKSYIIGKEDPLLHRKSLSLTGVAEKGEVLTEEKLMAVRSPDGIDPKLISTVVGRSTKRRIERYEVLTWDMI